MLQLLFGIGSVFFGQHPVRGTLKEMNLGSGLRDLGNELDGACCATDDAHFFVRKIEVPVPLRRVEGLAGKILQAFDVREHNLVEHADRADHDIRLLRRATAYKLKRPLR